MALAFFFDDPTYLEKASTDLLQLSAVIEHLSQPSFHINSNTDYVQLAARISFLDVGIDHGLAPTDSLSEQDKANFDREVDRLARTIKTMFTSLVDSGASHMTRTEAKEVLQLLHYRLIYAVRTRPEPKSSVFRPLAASADDPGGPEASFMKKFLSDDTSHETSVVVPDEL